MVSPESDNRGCGSDCNGISARQTKTACRVKSEKDESEKILDQKRTSKGRHAEGQKPIGRPAFFNQYLIMQKAYRGNTCWKRACNLRVGLASGGAET